MTPEDYRTQFEAFAEDNDLTITDTFLSRMAKRSKELERESDFTLDDIKEELIEIVPIRFQKSIEWLTFIDECAIFVFDEKEEGNSDEDDLYE